MDPEAFCYWLKGYLDTHVKLNKTARNKICEQLERTIEAVELGSSKPCSNDLLLENSTEGGS